MAQRDPRIDPQPGDVLLDYDDGKEDAAPVLCVWIITKRGADDVEYAGVGIDSESDGHKLRFPVADFSLAFRGAAVLRTAGADCDPLLSIVRHDDDRVSE